MDNLQIDRYLKELIKAPSLHTKYSITIELLRSIWVVHRERIILSLSTYPFPCKPIPLPIVCAQKHASLTELTKLQWIKFYWLKTELSSLIK